MIKKFSIIVFILMFSVMNSAAVFAEEVMEVKEVKTEQVIKESAEKKEKAEEPKETTQEKEGQKEDTSDTSGEVAGVSDKDSEEEVVDKNLPSSSSEREVQEFGPVKPILECVAVNGEGSYTAHFGYENENEFETTIAIGDNNKITGGGLEGQDQGQPTVFEYPAPNHPEGREGRTGFYPNNVFSVDFDGSNLVWTLTGPDGSTRTSTASANSIPCPEPEAEEVTIIADMILCEEESFLPNWGSGASNITSNTSADFVANNDGCNFASDRLFQWGDDSMTYSGDAVYGEVAGWNTTPATDSNGRTEFVVDLATLDQPNRIEMRKVLEGDDIPFTFETTNNNVSAEFYCHTDVFNYDNWDWINNPEVGETYYCVGFNVEEPEVLACEVGNLVVNGSFEEPALEGNWDLFTSEDTSWDTAWVSTRDGQPDEALLEIQNHIVDAHDGNQYVELDTDWGPGSGNGEPAGVAISQTLDTTPGYEYQVEFYTHARPDSSPEDNTLVLLITHETGENEVLSVQANDGWEKQEFKFVGLGDETEISFIYTGTENSKGVFLDDISVTCIGEVEPLECPIENKPVIEIENEVIYIDQPYTSGLLTFLNQLSGVTATDPDGGDVEWNIGNFEEVFLISEEGSYTVQIVAVDDEGCTSEEFITVIYEVDNEETDSSDDDADQDNDNGNENDEGENGEDESEDTSTSGSTGTFTSGGGSAGGQVAGVFDDGNDNVQGEVLGATDASCPQFTQFHRRGDTGGEVMDIQTFLNDHMNAGLVVDGVYGSQTEQAVHDFQQKYWDQTIKPWTPPFSPNTTGRWYKTTKAWANELVGCREPGMILEDNWFFYSTALFVNGA